MNSLRRRLRRSCLARPAEGPHHCGGPRLQCRTIRMRVVGIALLLDVYATRLGHVASALLLMHGGIGYHPRARSS